MIIGLGSIPRNQRIIEVYCPSNHIVAVLRKRPGNKPPTLDAVSADRKRVKAKWAWTDEGLAGVYGNPNTEPHWGILGAGVSDHANYACHRCVPSLGVRIDAAMIESALARYKGHKAVQVVSDTCYY
jgi:hypothetical protein